MSAAIENTNASESASAAAPVVMSIEQIMELFKSHRTQLAELEKAVKVALKAKGKRGAAKADKPKRAAGPWALWAKQMPLDHPEDFASFKAEKEAEAAAEGKKAKGVHILFAKMWRDSHTAEWEAFSAKVKAEAPEKPAKAPKAPKEAKPKAEKKAEKPAAKPKTEKAAAKPKAEKPAKKAEKPAKKAAPTPAPAAEEDEVSAELWTWKGKKYFRTSANECWLAEADGSMGKWAGVYDPVADDIDTDAEEPEVEME